MGWSSVGITRCFTVGFVDGPFGIDHDFRRHPALCFWMTKIGFSLWVFFSPRGYAIFAKSCLVWHFFNFAFIFISNSFSLKFYI